MLSAWQYHGRKLSGPNARTRGKNADQNISVIFKVLKSYSLLYSATMSMESMLYNSASFETT